MDKVHKDTPNLHSAIPNQYKENPEKDPYKERCVEACNETSDLVSRTSSVLILFTELIIHLNNQTNHGKSNR
jgi:hypothetical protein